MSVETLAQALLEGGILDAVSVEQRVSRVRTGRQLLESVVADGVLTETSLVNQLARALSVPRYDPKARSPEPEALALLERRVVEELGVLPVAVRGGGALLWVALCDPTDESLLSEVARLTGRRVKACVIGPRELTRALAQLAAHPAHPPPASPPSFGVPLPPPGAAMPPHVPLPYAPMPNPMGGTAPAMMPGWPAYAYGVTPPQPHAPGAAAPKSAEVARLEAELAQARQVVKVLSQMLVERGLIDGEEFKRRLRQERDRKQ